MRLASASSQREHVRWVRRLPTATLLFGLRAIVITSTVVGSWIYQYKLQRAHALAQKERDKLADEQQRLYNAPFA